MDNTVEKVEEVKAEEEIIFQCQLIAADLKLQEIKLLFLKHLRNKK